MEPSIKTQKAILLQLSAVRHEVTKRLASLAKDVPKHREENGYGQAMISYINAVEALGKEYTPRMKAIAESISAQGGKGWQDNKPIAQLWLEYAHTITVFQHNPKHGKGVGAVYVSTDNQLISYAASRFWLPEMRPSRKFRIKWLTLESRRHINICAEQGAIVAALSPQDLEAYEVIRKPLEDGAEKRRFIKISHARERMDLFRRRLTALAARAEIFDNSTLITTADPCGYCAPIVMAAGVTTLIGSHHHHADGLTHARQADIEEARREMRGLQKIIFDRPTT